MTAQARLGFGGGFCVVGIMSVGHSEMGSLHGAAEGGNSANEQEFGEQLRKRSRSFQNFLDQVSCQQYCQNNRSRGICLEKSVGPELVESHRLEKRSRALFQEMQVCPISLLQP